MNIANRITLWVLLAAVAVLVPMAYISYRSIFSHMLTLSSTIRAVLSQNVELNIIQRHEVIKSVSHMAVEEILAEPDRSPEKFNRFFKRCLQANDGFVGVIIAFAPDDFIADHRAWYLHRRLDRPAEEPVWVDLVTQEKSPYFTEREWFDIPRRTGKPHWSKPYKKQCQNNHVKLT